MQKGTTGIPERVSSSKGLRVKWKAEAADQGLYASTGPQTQCPLADSMFSLQSWPICLPMNSNLTSLPEGTRRTSSCVSCCPQKEELWEFL